MDSISSGDAGRLGGPMAFLREAVASLRTRRLLLPVVMLAVVLTASNIVILRNMPVKGGAFPSPFAAAAIVRVLGLVAGAVAILRVLNSSPRPSWRPDGAFWLYALTLLVGIAAGAVAGILVGGEDDPLAGLAVGMLVTIVTAPFAPWFAAIAVERPLAWRPGPWLRRFGAWLPPLLLWSLLLLTPLAELHGALDKWLIEGAGRYFWPVALFDGLLSVLLALIGLALASVAYRRVARIEGLSS